MGKKITLIVVISCFFCVPFSFAAVLSWDPLKSTENCVIAGYKVYYSTTIDYYTNIVDVGNTNTYDISSIGLVPNQTYFFAVSAYSTKNLEGPLCAPISYNESQAAMKSFVTRFYDIVLGRPFDQDGLDYWVSKLLNGQISGEDIAYSFIFSMEFEFADTTDDEFITILYHALLNRVPDTGGYHHWMDKLSQGMDRSTVLSGFTRSAEFINLCNTYGIMPY